MNRSELVASIASRTNLPAATVSTALDGLAEVFVACAADGTKVQVAGLLTLEAVDRAARVGRNPRTGEPIEIAATRGVRITPGSALKAAAKAAA